MSDRDLSRDDDDERGRLPVADVCRRSCVSTVDGFFFVGSKNEPGTDALVRGHGVRTTGHGELLFPANEAGSRRRSLCSMASKSSPGRSRIHVARGSRWRDG